MNKKAIYAFLVLLLAISVALVLRGRFDQQEGAVSSQGEDGVLPGIDQSSQTSALPPNINSDRVPIMNGPPQGSAITNNQVTGSLTPEEAHQIEEMFEVTSNLTELLDDDDNDAALLEARRLAGHTNRAVRMASLEAMEWIGAAATADIASFLNDPDPEIRQRAEDDFWNAVDELEDPAAKLDMLKISLNSTSSELRMAALDKMIYLPDALSFPVIAPMLNDADANVRDLAKNSLEFISDEVFTSVSQAMDWYNQHKSELQEMDDQ